EGRLVVVCPETMGGLPTPRPRAEIRRGRDGRAERRGGDGRVVVDERGRDVTRAFEDGAARALELARQHGCRYALLKEGSPSCGSSEIADGSFTGTRVSGRGLAEALLEAHGIEVFSEHQLGELAARL